MDKRTKRSCEEEEAAHPSELEVETQHSAQRIQSKAARCSANGRISTENESNEMESPSKSVPKEPIKRTKWSTTSRLVEAAEWWLDGPGNDATGKLITKGV